MTRIHEAARDVDVIHETDVLVVGSGPGGLSAALAAARTGARTTLLDRYGCFGGNITQVGVESIGWYRHERTVEANGIGRELEHSVLSVQGAIAEDRQPGPGIDIAVIRKDVSGNLNGPVFANGGEVVGRHRCIVHVRHQHVERAGR